MESQPQNPEFRINPENFHRCSWQSLINSLPAGKVCIFFCLLIFSNKLFRKILSEIL